MSPKSRVAWALRSPKMWWVLGGWLCTALLGLWLYDQLKAFQWGRLPSHVPWAWWPLAALAWMAGYGLRAWRLQQEWAHRAWVPWWRCLALVLRHNAAVLLVPMRLGEAGYLIGVARQWGVELREAAWSLLRLRLQDAAVLGGLALAWLLPGGAWMAGFLVAMMFALRQCMLWSPGQVRAMRSPVLSGLVQVLISPGWGHSVLIWTLRLSVIAGCLHLMAPATASTAIGAAVGAELGALWPLQGPAGLGPFELGAWSAARWLGEVPEGLLAAALIAHLFCVSIALLGAVATLWIQPLAAQGSGLRST